jgi:hypothetical protein
MTGTMMQSSLTLASLFERSSKLFHCSRNAWFASASIS